MQVKANHTKSTTQGKRAWNVSFHRTKGTDTREFNLKTCSSKRSINTQVEMTHIYTHTHTHTHMHIHIHTCVQTFMHTHTNTYMHMCIDTNTHIHLCSCLRNFHQCDLKKVNSQSRKSICNVILLQISAEIISLTNIENILLK